MKLITQTASRISKTFALASLLACSSLSFASQLLAVVDDFSHETSNKLGVPRQFVTDAVAGGKTQGKLEVVDGKLKIKGDIVPPRGQPGWASSVLLLDAKGMPQDVSGYRGVRLLVRVNKGQLSLTANSTDVTNFDYHAAPLIVPADGQFHEINVPFDSMKRAWSEQTALNTKTINGLSIVAFSLQQAAFDYELDEVRFY